MMKYRKNHNGDPVVDASPGEIYALRPCIFAYLRRHGCPVNWLEDCGQDVSIIVWQAMAEGRIKGDRVTTPQNALLRFAFMTSWYVWKNHSRHRAGWYEILSDEPPDMASRCPVACLEAREVLQHVFAEPRIASVLLKGIDGPETSTPRSTHAERVTRPQEPRVMKISYGMCNFAARCREGIFYVDEMPYIPQFENVGEHLIFLRPHWFGTFTLPSILEHYYDIGKADRFDELFRGLWIHENPTAQKIPVLSEATEAEIRRSFAFQINAASSLFAHRYAGLIPALAPLDGLIRAPELDVALLMIEQLRQG